SPTWGPGPSTWRCWPSPGCSPGWGSTGSGGGSWAEPAATGSVRPEGYGHGDLVAVPDDRQLHLLAGLVFLDDPAEFGGAGHGLAGHVGDQVALAQTGGGGRRAGIDADDEGAVGVGVGVSGAHAEEGD